MLDLPKEFILLDTEFTTWDGAQARDWSGPNEYREIVEIGALKVDSDTLEEVDSITLFVKPVKNPTLSDYFVSLTGISQQEIEEKGIDLESALRTLKAWANGLEFFSFGRDGFRIEENCKLINVEFPFDARYFHNLKELFQSHGIETDGYMSSTIIKAFGKEPARTGHDALNDTRLVLDALRALASKS